MLEDFNLEEDIIDLKTARKNLSQIVDEVANDHAHKVIIKNNKAAAVLVNVADYQALQDQLLAMELQMAYQEAKEAGEKGELKDWDDLVAELGIELSELPEEPKYSAELYKAAS